MLWMKVSLLAILYSRQSVAKRFSMVWAIGMGFLAMQPQVDFTLSMSRASDKGEVMLVWIFCGCGLCQLLMIFLCLLHFLGVFTCPSHDWSITHGGCTQFYAVSNTTA